MRKILQQWTLRRLLYLAMGILVGMQAIQDHMWFLLIPGVWFTVMGLFAMGCAGPSCGVEMHPIKAKTKHEHPSHE